MKAGFSSISAALKGNALPEAGTLHAFLADAEQMVTFRGYGDRHYAVFSRNCATLREAVASGDPEACRASFFIIADRMHKCHKRYKK